MDQAKVPRFAYVDFSRNSAVLNAIDIQHFFKSYWEIRPRSTGSTALDTELFDEHSEILAATMIRRSPLRQAEVKASVDVLGCLPADYLSEVKLSEERVPVDKSPQNEERIFSTLQHQYLSISQCTVSTTSKTCSLGGREGRAQKLENSGLDPQEMSSGINTTDMTTQCALVGSPIT